MLGMGVRDEDDAYVNFTGFGHRGEYLGGRHCPHVLAAVIFLSSRHYRDHWRLFASKSTATASVCLQIAAEDDAEAAAKAKARDELIRVGAALYLVQVKFVGTASRYSSINHRSCS